MKAFYKKIILFFLPLLLILGGMEIALRVIPNDYRYKKEYLDVHSEEIQTLILGSSHTFYGLNPAFFPDRAFNAAQVSQSLDYDAAIFSKYLFENLERIIIPVSYFTFFEQLHSVSDSWREKNYIIYYDINISDRLSNHLEITANDFFVNIKRLFLHYVQRKDNITVNSLGWGKIYYSGHQKDLLRTGKLNAFFNTKDLNAEAIQTLYEDNQKILRSIIENALERNIQVVLFTPPAYETYRQNLNKEQIELTVATAENIAAAYPNCTYINLLADNRFLKTDFYDADHLNEIGAEKLSRIIVNY